MQIIHINLIGKKILHKSNKSIIENKERFLMADSQSNKVLKKNLKSGIELSVSSKLLLLVSILRRKRGVPGS